jgi:hypothetical protein
LPYLDELYFGMADAGNDVAQDPGRFYRTYLDRWNIPDKVSDHSKFLLLGPKGSGKSAGAEYVALKWKETLGNKVVYKTFVDFDELNRTQSPLTQLDKKLVSDQVASMSDAAWKLFIGTRLLDSLIQDRECNLYNQAQVDSTVKQLRSAGLASDDYPSVLRIVRQRKGTIAVPNFLGGEISSAPTESLSPVQVGDAVFNLVCAATTPNRHLLAIDGLDKAIGDNPAYWQTLAALVRVADKYRKRLKDVGNTCAYVMVMCRSDVFRRVRFSDAAKVAADGGIQMDWAAEADDPLSVVLWEYVARKAEIPTAALLDTLPSRVTVRNRSIPIGEYVLQFTRYTPRDMTQFFSTLGQKAPRQMHATSEQVRDAADTFASDHLLLEIASEATGLLPDSVADKLEELISSLPSRIFTLAEFETAIQNSEMETEISAKALGEYLFLQGAIGNFRPGSGYVHFYHRRNTHKFLRQGPFILHSGLTYAFTIPWNRPTPLR